MTVMLKNNIYLLTRREYSDAKGETQIYRCESATATPSQIHQMTNLFSSNTSVIMITIMKSNTPRVVSGFGKRMVKNRGQKIMRQWTDIRMVREIEIVWKRGGRQGSVCREKKVIKAEGRCLLITVRPVWQWENLNRFFLPSWVGVIEFRGISVAFLWRGLTSACHSLRDGHPWAYHFQMRGLTRA